MSDKLEFAGVVAKPCPFCGGEELSWRSSPRVVGGAYFWFIMCDNDDCNTTGPADLGKSGAIDKWNGSMLIEEEE